MKNCELIMPILMNKIFENAYFINEYYGPYAPFIRGRKACFSGENFVYLLDF